MTKTKTEIVIGAHAEYVTWKDIDGPIYKIEPREAHKAAEAIDQAMKISDAVSIDIPLMNSKGAINVQVMASMAKITEPFYHTAERAPSNIEFAELSRITRQLRNSGR